ncbi:MAG: radical SAM protein [Bacteroidia bacterium]|nr:radical SAM protein [Bacteroidia bacterium]
MWQKRKELYQIIKLIDFTRFWNLHKLIFSYWISLITRKTKIWANPFAVSIEPTTNCNLNCAECPTGNNLLTRPLGKINTEIFHLIIDQIYKKTFYLNLYLQGEPFIHTQLTEMISYAIKKKMFVCVSTNGHFLDEATCDKLVKTGIQKIIISVDGATNETYNKYRKGGNLTMVTTGIKTLSESKIKQKTNLPLIVIQMLVNKYNEHEINAVKHLTEYYGANRLELKSMQIYNNSNFLSSISKYNRYIKNNFGDLILKSEIQNRCLRLWTNAVFTWDGNLIPCCYDKNANYIIGSIKDFDFETHWKNQKLNSFRNNVLNNRKNIDICCNCTE